MSILNVSKPATLFPKLSISARTACGPKRKNNEDAFVVVFSDSAYPDPEKFGMDSDSLDLQEVTVGHSGLFLAVIDGMGGADHGEKASKFLGLEFQKLFRRLLTQNYAGETKWKMSNKTVNSLLEVNDLLVAEVARLGARQMGAVSTIVWVKREVLMIFQVGDTRAYLLDGDNIRQLTHDQTKLQSALTAGLITDEEAKDSNLGNLVSQAFGAKKKVEPDVEWVETPASGLLMICSDGFHNSLNPGRAWKDFAQSAEPLPKKLSELHQASLGENNKDNSTIIAVEFMGGDSATGKENDKKPGKKRFFWF